MLDANAMLKGGENLYVIMNKLLEKIQKLQTYFHDEKFLKLGMDRFKNQAIIDQIAIFGKSEKHSISTYKLDRHFKRAAILIEVFNKYYENRLRRYFQRNSYEKILALVNDIEVFTAQISVWIENQEDKKVQLFSYFILGDQLLYGNRLSDGQIKLLYELFTGAVHDCDFSDRMRKLGNIHPAHKEAHFEESINDFEAQAIINSHSSSNV